MTEPDESSRSEAAKPPQKKAGKTVSRVVDPNAWRHADEDHPGIAEPSAEPDAESGSPVEE